MGILILIYFLCYSNGRDFLTCSFACIWLVMGNFVLISCEYLRKYPSWELTPFLQHVTPDSYIPCLADLCKALWEVMLSYYRTMEWHGKHDSEETLAASGRKRFGLRPWDSAVTCRISRTVVRRTRSTLGRRHFSGHRWNVRLRRPFRHYKSSVFFGE